MDYNDIAVNWEAMQKYTPAPRHRRRLIINLMQAISFQSVLDIGCGKGLMLNQIGKKFRVSLTGCDISEKAIYENKINFPEINFHQLDISKEFLSEKFDIVICSEVIEHLVEYKKAIKHLSNMTEKYLIITVPSCPLFNSDKNMGHIRHFSGDDICEVLKEKDFIIKNISKWGFPFFNLYKHLLNGYFSRNIQKRFAQNSDYSFWQKLISQILYLLFFINFKYYNKGYQLIIMAERV